MNAIEAIDAPEGAQKTSEKRILIVDDEQAMQLLASTIVRRLGYSPTTAASGEEAIERFREAFLEGNGYEAVVMDLALPGGMSGLEATIAIKQINGLSLIHISEPTRPY